MMKITSRVFGIALVFCFLFRTTAQERNKTIILNVRVTDSNNHAVVDVAQERFQVLEDGVPQKITLFSNKQVPLSYGLVIDNSGSLRSQLAAVVRSGMKIVNTNTADDEAFLVRFISSDKLETVQDVTWQKELLLKGLEGLYVEGGQTAVIDAVYVSADKLAKLKRLDNAVHRKALILVTDGEDRNSYYRPEQLFSLLGTTDVQVYVIGFTSELKPKPREKAVSLLSRLATDTGGRAFFPKTIQELDSISDEIINDIRTQYMIGYAPTNSPDANFHKVQVSIADDSSKEHRVAVTRLGYASLDKQPE